MKMQNIQQIEQGIILSFLNVRSSQPFGRKENIGIHEFYDNSSALFVLNILFFL